MADLILPGFQTPDSPKLDMQLTATAMGNIEFLVLSNVPLDQPTHTLTVLIGQEHGREIRLMARSIDNTLIIERPSNGGRKDVFVRITNQDLVMYPGTYMVRVLDGDTEILVKSLTVHNHPALE